MPGLDPNIILQAGRNSVPLADLGQIYGSAAQIQNQQAMAAQHAWTAAQQQATARSYADSLGSDGTIDQTMLMKNLANYGAGGQIPAVLKSQLENRKVSSEIDKNQSGVNKDTVSNLYAGLKQADETIAGLLAKPNVTENDVFSSMGMLVRAGAFDVQAQHQNQRPDEYAMNMLSTMPRGNPAALHDWLMQAGARTMDATKRFELQLPKFDAQNRGGVLNEGTIDQMTGQRTASTAPGQNITLTADPNAVLGSQTQRRGQDITASTERRGQDINATTQRSGIQETPQGYATVDKVTGLARPIATMDGQPVLPANSAAAAKASQATTIVGLIDEAKKLLPNATASGAGAIVDKALNAFGVSTASAEAAAQLDTLGAHLASNVPRFEGPQSDKDVALYKQAAGDVANRSLPYEQRVAALGTLKTVMTPYIGRPGTGPATLVRPQGSAPQGGTVPYTPSPALRAQAGAGGQRPALDSFFTR